jgi:hypothetical protein
VLKRLEALDRDDVQRAITVDLVVVAGADE